MTDKDNLTSDLADNPANGLIPKSKATRLKTLVRAVFFAAFCGVVLIGNYFWEQATSEYNAAYLDEVQFTGDKVYLPWNGYIVGNEGEVKDYVSLEIENDDDYVFTLNEGRIWGNFGTLGSRVNLQVGGKIVIIPSFSDVDISYDGSKVSVSTHRGNTYVGFLPDELTQFKYMDEHDEIFANVLLIPQGMQAVISLDKTGDRLKPLLSSKLAKEFSYDYISDEKYDDEFVKENLEKGVEFTEALKEFYRGDFGEVYDSFHGVSSSAFDWLSKNLVVFDEKKERYAVEELNQYIYEALLADDVAERNDALGAFENLKKNLSEKFFDGWFKKLVVFSSSDPEFEVLKFLVDKAEGTMDKLRLLSLRFGMYNGDFYVGTDAKNAFGSTYEAVENLFGFTNDIVLYRKVLSFCNQIFDGFFMSFADLYQQKYFDMKDRLEKELFGLYEKGWMKGEMKQSFVNEKIGFLKQLRDFFFDEKVGIEDARKIMSYLIESIDYYMPVETSRAAVIDLFEEELDDIGNYWGYINSVEYSKSALYGSTHKERYEVYLAEREQITGILDVQKDILGANVVGSAKISDVTKEIGDAFKEIGATDVYIEEFDDAQKRFIKVAAVLDGYSFDAEYDRDYGYVKNVYAYGELLTESNVKLKSLGDFLTKKLSDVVEEAAIASGDAGDTGTKETNAQKIAKTIVVKDIVQAGFSASMNDIDILDPVNAVYRLNDVAVGGTTDVKVSFNYHANDGNVENVFVLKNGEGTTITGVFPLSELKDIVLEEHY
ncbi:MAG: hypothetical protein WC604_02835 [Candidatus Gracilibacteria bacterium]